MFIDQLGDQERALAGYQRLLHEPGAAELLNVCSLKADPRLSLREDPRFQALVNDPANNAPLF